MMRSNMLRAALGGAALLLGLARAHADYALTASTAAANAQLTVCGFSVASVIAPCHVIVDSAKQEMFKAANPAMVGLVFGGSALTLGQKVMAGSVPVVLPSDQTVPTFAMPSESHVGQVGGDSIVATASFAQPANTTAYASGQLVSNSTTAGSVVPLQLTVARKAGTGRITRIRLSNSNPGVVNATFRVHLFRASPTATVGDGGTFAGAVNGVTSVYLGSYDVTLDKAFSDGAKGIGAVGVGAYVTFDTAAGSQAIYGLVEARSAYTPTSGETITVTAEVDRD